MRTTVLAAALALLVAAPLHAAQPTRIPDTALARAAQLQAQALRDDTGWKTVEALTTEVGPRLAGSEADARAVEWAKARFKALGFDRVWTEPVTFPKWERRSESAQVLGAHAQALHVTALGGSPGGTIEGEVVRFDSLEALQQAAPGSLAGKIAFVDVPMPRSRSGEGYGQVGSKIRGAGPSAAARAGAIGYLMRSAGTDMHRNPHTGISRFQPGVTPIPMAALSLPDADQLTRLVALGPTRVKLALDCGWNGEYTSQNVIGEITGRSKPNEVVVIGGHLDSWDLGTGAIDDGAGVAITMAAGHLIAQLPKAQRPARSLRVIAFANEEQGLWGGRAYAEAHKAQLRQHQIGAESDFGAGRIYAFKADVPAHAQAALAQIAQALAPLGITAGSAGEEACGPDLSPFHALGMACAGLAQDGTDYFDYHHTPDDTLDKIDPAALAQNVAAYVTFAYLAADADGDFGSAPKPEAAAPAAK
ncbi:M28 family peptidase [Thermomonas haemolytica]|uniref:Carboxypeptidase Q n=1 Tax=Thermomonas haemolytica TaxID=141949 RepID=A0A4R3N2U6_9GAMM|nr:M28 family peptidase [Thermomonas haemolytica]TCT23440.1 Zn-dependent M28 family amino/carboxypeptidase [Thermomonas haemolytica]TNY28498.1 aminopeptidase [Thermomonas haemolytica]